jgi:hypothetical protein
MESKDRVQQIAEVIGQRNKQKIRNSPFVDKG